MTSKTQEHLVGVLFELLAAFNDGDLSSVQDRVDPEVRYLIPGRAIASGDFWEAFLRPASQRTRVSGFHTGDVVVVGQAEP
jgi:hypothetical protein